MERRVVTLNDASTIRNVTLRSGKRAPNAIAVCAMRIYYSEGGI